MGDRGSKLKWMIPISERKSEAMLILGISFIMNGTNFTMVNNLRNSWNKTVSNFLSDWLTEEL